MSSGKHTVVGSTAFLKKDLLQNSPDGNTACRFRFGTDCLLFQKIQIVAGWQPFPPELTLFMLLMKKKH